MSWRRPSRVVFEEGLHADRRAGIQNGEIQPDFVQPLIQQIGANRQFQRLVDIALLLIAADVNVLLAGPAVGEPMDQPGVGVEVEDEDARACEYDPEIISAISVKDVPRRSG